MVNLLARLLWFVAGAATSLFVTSDTLRFSIFQAMAAIVIVVALIVAAVYLPVLAGRLRGRDGKAG